MKKFCVFSGFLGSGKTTTMMALTKYFSENYAKAAMISNDLGHGVSLADNRLAELCGCNASQMTEDCICYQNENLADRLDSLYSDGCEIVISDIPGFGVGALEHVYHGLNEKFPGRFELAPFTVLAEPATVRLLMKGEGGDLDYIYRTQLSEADLIVLNKCDTVSDEEKNKLSAWLKEEYPEADVICISALTGDGFDLLSAALKNGSASMRRPDIGYGGEAFMGAMSEISEYYIQYFASVCCNDFDGNDYLNSLADSVSEDIAEAGFEIPHLKLLAWEGEGDYGKRDLIGKNRPVEYTHNFSNRCTDIAVILNSSAQCPAVKLDEIITGAVDKVSKEYNLEITIHKKECMAMGPQ